MSGPVLTAEDAESAEKTAMREEAELNQISEAAIDGAIDVHRALGPGLLESAYEASLAFELAQRGLKVEAQ